jgi:tetratricopeptide (TPR) repeat protein
VTAAEAGTAAVILDHVWVGAGIHIHTAGSAGSAEPFLPWRGLPDDPDAVFTLLSWRARLAPLVGRERDKSTLLQWARQGRRARIRLLSGPGGVGKSRLAAEVAEMLRAEGWTAGFVRPNDPVIVPLRRAGLFLIVDYPEENPDEVRALLREFAFRELREVPMRLLVLSRQGGDRWFDFVESAHAGELMDAQELGLSGLAATDPAQVVVGSQQRLVEHYRRPAPAISANAVRAWVALNPGLHGLPLLLTASAIHSFLNDDGALDYNGSFIIQALTNRERSRLDNAGRAAGLGKRGASRLVALAAVPGSLDASALRRLADPALEIGLPSPDRVVDTLISLPWWHGDHISSPEPDLMAAALLVRSLSERSDKASDWLWAVMEYAEIPHLIDRLGRLAFDTLTVTGSALGFTRYLRKIIADDQSRAQAFAPLVKQKQWPFGIARFEADIIEALLRTSTEEENTKLLNTLSVCLSDDGDYAGALVAVREAERINRRLARDDPARFDSDLASTLNNLSNHLARAGDNANSLVAIQEAVDIRRRLTHQNSALFGPDLALNLGNLSNRLADAGDYNGALVAIREAVEITGWRTSGDPARFGFTLNILSSRLREAGEGAMALTAILLAERIYRQLARDNPARFDPNLALTLHNLSNGLADSGNDEGAMAAIREAVDIRRRLAQDNPARFEPDLAWSLVNLSSCLSNAGDLEHALTALRDAERIHYRLARDNPGRFNPRLASNLVFLSIRLNQAGDKPNALAKIQHAERIYRELARDNPARFDPDLALTLHNLSNRLADAGHHEEAVSAIREAVDIRRRLAQNKPARFEPDLARSLDTLWFRLRDVGDAPGAMVAIREAVDIRRRLAQDNPTRFDPDLALSVGNLSLSLKESGDITGALSAIREATNIHYRLKREAPARFNPAALDWSVRLLKALEQS